MQVVSEGVIVRGTRGVPVQSEYTKVLTESATVDGAYEGAASTHVALSVLRRYPSNYHAI